MFHNFPVGPTLMSHMGQSASPLLKVWCHPKAQNVLQLFSLNSMTTIQWWWDWGAWNPGRAGWVGFHFPQWGRNGTTMMYSGLLTYTRALRACCPTCNGMQCMVTRCSVFQWAHETYLKPYLLLADIQARISRCAWGHLDGRWRGRTS